MMLDMLSTGGGDKVNVKLIRGIIRVFEADMATTSRLRQWESKDVSNMSSLTMRGVAELAQVRRPVVSMWRRRLATSAHPFPPPIQEHPLLFDADQVAHWLRETGHGNNGEALDESALHSSKFSDLTGDLEVTSTLLLLHHLRGEPVAGTSFEGLLSVVDESCGVLDQFSVQDALADHAAVAAVDAVVEAAFSAARVMDRLVDGLQVADGPWAAESLTPTGEDLIATVLAELHRAAPRVVAPVGAGGLLLAHLLVRRLDEPERARSVLRYVAPDRDCDRLAWRRLAAFGCDIVPAQEAQADRPVGQGVLHLLLQQQVSDESAFFDDVETRLVELGEEDVLILVGPARLLVDSPGAAHRRRLLLPSEQYASPLRYVAPLPKGLSRHGGRRRLALWVFGRSDSTWTVAGDHADARVDRASREAIAADVVAAISGPDDVNAHAFHASAVLESRRFLRSSSLAVSAPMRVQVDGGDRLARIWELDRGLLDGIDLVAAEGAPRVIALTEAHKGLGRDLAGVRLDDAHLDATGSGTATVVGPAEVRDPTLIGRRRIDRLLLEQVAPRAKMTEPGDVVYAAVGGPAAWVDRSGGHVVRAPARIFRCANADHEHRRLVPSVVAADIRSQPGTDRSTWRLRTVPADRAVVLTEIDRRIEGRRAQVEMELRALAELQEQVTDGLADGSLNESPTTEGER